MKHKHLLFSSYILISLSFVRYDWMFRQKVVVHFIYYLKSWSDILHSMLLQYFALISKLNSPCFSSQTQCRWRHFCFSPATKSALQSISTARSRLENKEKSRRTKPASSFHPKKSTFWEKDLADNEKSPVLLADRPHWSQACVSLNLSHTPG